MVFGELNHYSAEEVRLKWDLADPLDELGKRK